MVKSFKFQAQKAARFEEYQNEDEAMNSLLKNDVSHLKALLKVGLLQGFEANEIMVKSNSSKDPHIVKMLLSGGISYDKNLKDMVQKRFVPKL